MAKRAATTAMTQDTWDEELPREEIGEFKRASNEEMSTRVVKKARRSGNFDNSTPNKLFEGLKNFASSSSTDKPLFGFLSSTNTSLTPSNVPQDATNGMNGTGTTEHNPNITPFKLSTLSSANCTSTTPVITTTSISTMQTLSSTVDSSTGNGKATHEKRVNSTKPSTQFFQQLKNLNESVLSWLNEHVEKDPYCILSPIFTDYDNHVKDLQEKHGMDFSSFAGGSVSSSVKPSTLKPLTTDSMETAKPTFQVNLQSLKSGDLDTNQTKEGGEEEEEYTPLRNEFQEVKEDSAFYSIRCKLFFKKDSDFKEKGVGTLYLKSTNEKTQLLIRAETSLGNILLNILLTRSIPTSRVGKNNVTLVCIPNPPIDPRAEGNQNPVTFLIRVKTSEDADVLLAKLEEHKS